MVFVISEYKAKKKSHVNIASSLRYDSCKGAQQKGKKRGYCRREAFWAFFFVLGCCQGASEQQRQSYSGEGVCEYMLFNPSPVLLFFFLQKRTLKKRYSAKVIVMLNQK